MKWVTTIAIAGLGVSAALCLLRALLGKTIADRIVALDSILIMIGSGLAVYGVRIRSGEFLGLLIAAALVGFVGTVAVARFIEMRD